MGNRLDRTIVSLNDVFNSHKTSDKQNGEGDGQPIEVFVDKYFDRGAIFPDQPAEQEEAESATNDGCDDKHRDVEFEDPGRDGDQLVGDRGESGCEDHPEVVLVVDGADVFVLFVGKSGDNPEEEVGDCCKFTVWGELHVVADSIASHSTQD